MISNNDMKELMSKITFLVPGQQKSQVDIYVGKFHTETCLNGTQAAGVWVRGYTGALHIMAPHNRKLISDRSTFFFVLGGKFL